MGVQQIDDCLRRCQALGKTADDLGTGQILAHGRNIALFAIAILAQGSLVEHAVEQTGLVTEAWAVGDGLAHSVIRDTDADVARLLSH